MMVSSAPDGLASRAFAAAGIPAPHSPGRFGTARKAPNAGSGGDDIRSSSGAKPAAHTHSDADPRVVGAAEGSAPIPDLPGGRSVGDDDAAVVVARNSEMAPTAGGDTAVGAEADAGHAPPASADPSQARGPSPLRSAQPVLGPAESRTRGARQAEDEGS